jgi:hypothetical protein
MQKFEFLCNTERTPRIKRAIIAAASSGNNEIVAAVTGKIIRVYQLVVVSAGTVTTRWESAADGTALTGQIPLVANSGYAPPWNPMGHFETAAGQALNLELSGAIAVAGWLSYAEI